MAALIVNSSLAEDELTGTSLVNLEALAEKALDLGNTNIEQTAVTIAKDYPGEYNINQVSAIFDTLIEGWYTISDPNYKDKWKNANLTLRDGHTSESAGMGDCDDFAILMASLIASLGGSARITIAANATSTEGHAYCELFLGKENDPQVNDVINWIKAQYSLTEVLGLDRTGDEVWLNLDWWDKNLGGRYLEGDIGKVVWQSPKLVSPKIVPIIDSMDTTAGWDVVKDNLGSNAIISLAPAKKGRGSAINMTYDLKEGGWAGISKDVDPELFPLINGLNFSYSGMSKQNTLELRLVDDNGTEFGTSWKPVANAEKWQYLQALFDNFECMDSDEKCSAKVDVLNLSKVKKLEIIVSCKPKEGDTAGHGKVDADHIVGVMNIPPGSPWARAEEQMRTAVARDLAAQSERVGDNIKKAQLAVESLSHQRTLEGDLALRRSVDLLPICRAQCIYNKSAGILAFSPDGTKLATSSQDDAVLIWDALNGRELQRLKHNGSVSSVAFSPNGTRLATGSWAARIWDLQTGREICMMQNDTVRSLAFSPDGTKLATGSWDNGTARIWDLQTCQELQNMKLTSYTREVAFSPDGTRLGTVNDINFFESSNSHKTAQIWDVQTGQETQELENESEEKILAFSADGKRVTAVDSRSGAKIWDLTTGKELLSLDANGETMALSEDGERLASRDDTGQVLIIWDIPDRREITRLTHDYYVRSAIFSHDGTLIATTCNDGTSRTWNASTGKELARMPNDGSSIAFNQNATNVVTAGDEKPFRIWDAVSRKQLFWKSGEDNSLPNFDEVIFNPNGTEFVTTENNAVFLWDIATGGEIAGLKLNGSLYLAGFNSNGTKLAIIDEAEELDTSIVKIWDIRKGQEIDKLVLKSDIKELAFSPDFTKLAIVSPEKIVDECYYECEISDIRIWYFSSGKEYNLTINGSVDSIAFSQDGTKLVAILDGRIRSSSVILDVEAKIELSRLEHNGSVDFAAFSPDGLKVVTASDDGTAIIWDVVTGVEMERLNHNGPINFVSFSPDGKKVATASDDNTAAIWDVTNGEKLESLDHDNAVQKIIFSLDGAKIATFAYDKNVRVWSTVTGGELSRLELSSLPVSMAFSQSGRRIVTASYDGFVRISQLESNDLICDACSRLACNLTSQKWWEEYCSKCIDSNAYLPG